MKKMLVTILKSMCSEEVIKADADFIATLTDSDKWIESFRDESKRLA